MVRRNRGNGDLISLPPWSDGDCREIRREVRREASTADIASTGKRHGAVADKGAGCDGDHKPRDGAAFGPAARPLRPLRSPARTRYRAIAADDGSHREWRA